jgi:hypothetical protein
MERTSRMALQTGRGTADTPISHTTSIAHISSPGTGTATGTGHSSDRTLSVYESFASGGRLIAATLFELQSNPENARLGPAYWHHARSEHWKSVRLKHCRELSYSALSVTYKSLSLAGFGVGVGIEIRTL